MLIDYAHTYPGVIIRYHACDICFYTDSDAVYLVQPCARSRVGGHFYLSNNIPEGTSTPKPTPNGAILTECHNVRNVMS